MLGDLLRGLVDGSVEPEPQAPADAKPWLDDLVSQADTYRDAALMALAFALDAGTTADIADSAGGPSDGGSTARIAA